MLRYLLVIPVFYACGATDEDKSVDAPNVPIADAPGVTPDVPPAPELPDLSGTWAMRDILVTRTQVPVGGPQESQTISFFLVSNTAAGENAYDSRQELCDVQLTNSDNSATNTIGANYVATRVDRQRRIEVTEPAQFNQARALLVEGADLPDPANSPLPTSSDLSYALDDDNDQQPGFTMNINIVILGQQSIYVTQRTELELDGTIAADGTIRGDQIIHRFESNILGATNSLLLSASPPVGVQDGSVFVMKRMPDGSDCNAVKALDETSFFGPR